jgi:hypothetical protein
VAPRLVRRKPPVGPMVKPALHKTRFPDQMTDSGIFALENSHLLKNIKPDQNPTTARPTPDRFGRPLPDFSWPESQ